MHVILIAAGMHINPYNASLTTKPCSSKSTCTTNLILLYTEEGFRHLEQRDAET